MTFKIGDWVFYEYQLAQIQEMEGPRVTGISTGYIHSGGNDLRDRCKPLTLSMKVVSESFDMVSSRLHRQSCGGLNFPEIHQWLVTQWLAACEVAENEKAIRAAYDRLNKFEKDILDKQNVDSGYGFSLMRGR